MINKDRIFDLVDKDLQNIQNTFKRLHQHPELAFNEVETSKYVRQELKILNIPFREGYAKTGILGVLKCKNPKKRIIALRADMDALPVEEEVDLPYRSKEKGVMHACGHDAHTSTLLGVAKILSSLKDEMEGTFLLVFQPAEERYPGGANTMLKENIFEGYTPNAVLGLHVIPDIPLGKIGFRTGLITAATDELHITVHGQGGHAALVKDRNPVLAAANMLMKLQAIPDKLAPVRGETILAFGRFIADGIMNVIPEQVKLDGTLRTLDEEWRADARQIAAKMAKEATSEYGCSCDFCINHGYPSVINDDSLNTQAEDYAKELLGEENVTTFDKRMTGEDFGYFSQRYPSLFFRVGIGSKKFNCGGMHAPNFVVDPDALRYTTASMAWLAINFMKEEK